MSTVRSHTRTIHCAMAALATAGLTGCGALSPYQHMALAGPRADVVNPAGIADPRPAQILAGDIESALLDIEAQRLSLFDKLDASAVRRSLGASSLYAIGGWAALSGMKPNPTDADALRATRLAVAGSTLYLATDYGINTSQEDIHARTYNALTCLVAQSKPLVWALSQVAEPKDSIVTTDAAAGTHVSPVRSRSELSRALDRLEGQINLSYARFEAFTRNERWEQFAPNVRTAIRQRQTALNLARTSLREGRSLLQEIDQSGRTLRNRAAMIMAAANADLQVHQKALPAAESQLASLRSLVDNFKGVGKQTETDDAAKGDEPLVDKPPTEASRDGAGSASASASGASASAPSAGVAKEAQGKEVSRSKSDAAAQQPLFACAPNVGPTCRKDEEVGILIQQTNLLHALRRPVAAALVNFRQGVREVSAHNVCQAAPQWVTIMPSEARSIKAPGVLEFAISAAVGGIPRVGLTGNTGSATSAQALVVRADNGVLLARIALPADTPAGELTLWATDALGRHGQQVTITVTD